ncbi:hypothetical protein ACFPC0_10860 [Streptomyces andamanensis]|uniref:Uncharacterized protein n=1 Tax=Streptomyces andamanensis TaxID=1565035 RepID=A0ABV8TCH8_9ACTN
MADDLTTKIERALNHRGNTRSWMDKTPEEISRDEEPWMLAVTLSPSQYGDAAQRTVARINGDWGFHLGSDLRPGDCSIVLAGPRYHLIGALGFYTGGWSSAQIELRPKSAVLPDQEG